MLKTILGKVQFPMTRFYTLSVSRVQNRNRQCSVRSHIVLGVLHKWLYACITIKLHSEIELDSSDQLRGHLISSYTPKLGWDNFT